MKILFLGTPEFALPSLEAIHREGWEIGAVLTRPDSSAGRGRKKTPPPVKSKAEELGLKVWQPPTLAGPRLREQARELAPDLIVGVAYGKLIPPDLLGAAPKGGINLHPSLLPRYRGAAPIQWALINGETVTGVTVLYFTEKMDAGNILGQEQVGIGPEDNAVTLSERLAFCGARLLVRVIGEIEEGRAKGRPQDETLVTRAPLLKKEDGLIDWERPAREISDLVRGLYPWPGAYTMLSTPKGDKRLKIIKSSLCPEGKGRPGEVLAAQGGRLIVAAGVGALKIAVLQLEGRRPIGAGEFLRGVRLEAGQLLGQ